MPNRFCAICGKKLDKNAPNFNICLNCYVEENPLFELPEKLKFTICSDCFAFSKKNEWIEPENENILEIISEAIHQLILQNLKNYEDIEFDIEFNRDTFGFTSKDLLDRLQVEIMGQSISNPEITHKEPLKITINYEMCSNCSNIRGGTHYVSILQLRVKDERFFDFLKKIVGDIQNYVENLHKEESKQYISKMVDQKNGLDLYLSTNQLLNYIISHLRDQYDFYIKRSKKLVGRDIQRGKNIYRLKAVIKFLPVDKNDIIIFNNERYIVENILKNKVIMKSEKNHKITKKYNFFFNSHIQIE